MVIAVLAAGAAAVFWWPIPTRASPPSAVVEFTFATATIPLPDPPGWTQHGVL